MKDVFDVRRSENSDEVLKSLNGHIVPVVDVADATYNIEDYQSGTIFSISKLDGCTINLPKAQAGLTFTIYLSGTLTGGTTLISADSDADTFQGVVANHDKDHLGTAVALNENIDTDGWNFPAAADYRLTLDAATDGWFLGGHIKVVGLSTTKWLITGDLFGDGTVSHIFS